jgi:hypothetical protein
MLNFSRIKTKAKIAAKIGPVVKLIVLESARGIKAIAAYCMDFEIKFKKERRIRNLI